MFSVQYHVLFTNMFSHSEGWHFFLNMFAFFSFAPNTNSVLGNFDFTMAYLSKPVSEAYECTS